jgi:sterol desaturase/sphingolipid hydroxylase (fatty acid hydroxylase superfamily)
MTDIALFIIGSGLPIFAVVAIVGMLVERTRPARTDIQREHISLDAIYAVCHVMIAAGLGPLAAVVAAEIVRSLGGGFIRLPDTGVLGLLSFAVYLFARDLLEYWAHRAQHVVPWLWRMHSLHHSEPAYNVLTTLRHFWCESALKIVFLYPILAVVFDAPAVFVATASVIYFLVNFWAHLNSPFSLGRFSMWLNNPRFHRIHHSVEPRHVDKNFADLFPFIDTMFGTVVRPEPRQFPDTGLLSAERPGGIWQALAWPFIRRA